MQSAKRITKISLFTAIICVVSPFAINVGVIPISLCSLAIYLTAIFLNTKDSFFAVLCYVLLGLVGLPIFANFNSGIGAILSPTGGFIVGYLILVVIVSVCKKNVLIQLWGFILGTIALYLCGLSYYMLLTNTTFIQAIIVCVVPFIIGDIIKIIIGIVTYSILQKRLIKLR